MCEHQPPPPSVENDLSDCSDSDEQSEAHAETDSLEDTEIIRAKWTMDGAKTLDEAAEKLQAFALYLQQLKQEGWELVDEINDDYGFIRQRPATQA